MANKPAADEQDKSFYDLADKYVADDDEVQLVTDPGPYKLDIRGTLPQPTSKLQIAIAILQFVTFVAVIIVLGISAAALLQDNSDTDATAAPTTASLTGNNKDDMVYNCTLNAAYAAEVSRNYSMLQKQMWDINAALQGQGGIAQVLNSTAATLGQTAAKVDDIQQFTDDEAINSMNQTNMLSQVIQTTQSASTKLTGIISTLSNIKDTGAVTLGVVDDIFGVVQELLELQNASSLFNSITPVSCADIKSVIPSAPTGYYHVNSRNIYCNMDQLCGVTGGWTRIGYLDMSDSSQNCPPTFSLYTYQGVRYCKRSGYSSGCNSVSFPTNGLNYTEICGRVTSYTYAHTDAFSPANQGYGLESYYVDGVSITRGSPRQHVWTLASGLFENRLNPTDVCPCAQGSSISVPSYVGSNYYCESGNPNNWYQSGRFYKPSDALWDGQDCSALESPCCTNPMMPWFYRNFTSSSSDFIELRQCGNESPYAEDTPTKFYEIYIK